MKEVVTAPSTQCSTTKMVSCSKKQEVTIVLFLLIVLQSHQSSKFFCVFLKRHLLVERVNKSSRLVGRVTHQNIFFFLLCTYSYANILYFAVQVLQSLTWSSIFLTLDFIQTSLVLSILFI